VNTGETGARAQLWRFGRRTRDWLVAKHAWAPFEPLVLWVSPRLIRPIPGETVVTLPGGFLLRLPPRFPSAVAYLEGTYEPRLTEWLLRTVQPGWTVVDGGANVGYYTLLLSQCVGPSGQVFAFEPDPKNFEYLLGNLRANRCTNVQVLQAALSDRAGTSAFATDRFRAEGHLVTSSRPPAGTIEVKMIRLDEFLAEHAVPSVHLVKLDVEGGEVRVLRGMSGVAAASPQLRLVVECNPWALRRMGFSTNDLLAAVHALGFTKARSLDGPAAEISLERGARVDGPSQNLLVWR
jgi:FkbM family methyltransferase